MNSQLLISISQNSNEPKETIAQKRFYKKIHEKTFYNHSVKKTDDTGKKTFNDNDDIFLIFNKQKLNYFYMDTSEKYTKPTVLRCPSDISCELPNLNKDLLAGDLPKEEIILNLFNKVQDLYANYNITEYQPISRYIYQIQDKPLEELQQNYFHALADEERFNLLAVKMKYNNFISGNYDVIVDNYNNLNIIEYDLPAFINSLAINIVQTRATIFDPQQTIEHKIHVFNNFLNELNKIINKTLAKDTINTEITTEKMVANADKLYRKTSILNSTYDKYFSSYQIEKQLNKLTNIPKFSENDVFYLLFEKHTNRFGNYHSANGQHLKINEPYKTTAIEKEILKKIIAELKHYPYDFLFGFPVIYTYPPECYQSIAKFCYDLENKNSDDLLGYNKCIQKDWRVAKITYGDYVTENYKVVLDSNLNRTITTKDKKFTDLYSKLAVAVEECKHFINDYISEENINNDWQDKISVLQDLFAPIDTKDKCCTIEDFCLSADLTIGSTFIESKEHFESYQH